MFARVVDVDNCYLQNELSDRIRNSIREYALDNGLGFYDSKEHKGFLRTLVVRTASEDETMVILNLQHEDEPERVRLMKYIQDSFPEITSLMYVINPKLNDTFSDLDVRLFSGKDYIT
jgi:23S rRNA (uracil1939-C5)-methyltransferase